MLIVEAHSELGTIVEHFCYLALLGQLITKDLPTAGCESHLANYVGLFKGISR